MERHPLRLRTAAIAALLLGFAASMTAYAAGQGPAANGLTPGTDLRKATTEPGPATASTKALLAQVRRRQGAKAPASLGTRRAALPSLAPTTSPARTSRSCSAFHCPRAASVLASSATCCTSPAPRTWTEPVRTRQPSS